MRPVAKGTRPKRNHKFAGPTKAIETNIAPTTILTFLSVGCIFFVILYPLLLLFTDLWAYYNLVYLKNL